MTIAQDSDEAALERIRAREAWIREQVRLHFCDGRRSYVVEVWRAFGKERWGVSIPQVRRALKSLEAEGVIKGETILPTGSLAQRRYYEQVRS